jgi:transcription antitermination factor NusG
MNDELPNQKPKKWFVFYTKSRQEKKVFESLIKHGFTPFLPTQKLIKQWSDRKKTVIVPLFNSYIFVKVEESRIDEVLKNPGVAWSIKHNGKAAFLRDSEIDLITKYLETGLLIDTNTPKIPLTNGDPVLVMDGPLKGMEGILTKQNNDSLFTILIETINFTLSVHLNGNVLVKKKEPLSPLI